MAQAGWVPPLFLLAQAGVEDYTVFAGLAHGAGEFWTGIVLLDFIQGGFDEVV